jgi:hypothetical protein
MHAASVDPEPGSNSPLNPWLQAPEVPLDRLTTASLAPLSCHSSLGNVPHLRPSARAMANELYPISSSLSRISFLTRSPGRTFPSGGAQQKIPRFLYRSPGIASGTKTRPGISPVRVAPFGGDKNNYTTHRRGKQGPETESRGKTDRLWRLGSAAGPRARRPGLEPGGPTCPGDLRERGSG